LSSWASRSASSLSSCAQLSYKDLRNSHRDAASELPSYGTLWNWGFD